MNYISRYRVQFTFSHPDATNVYLLGQFNNWSTTATPMRYVGDDCWEVTLHLPGDAARYACFVFFGAESKSSFAGRTAICPVGSRSTEPDLINLPDVSRNVARDWSATLATAT